jgi:hypothetical protein
MQTSFSGQLDFSSVGRLSGRRQGREAREPWCIAKWFIAKMDLLMVIGELDEIGVFADLSSLFFPFLELRIRRT